MKTDLVSVGANGFYSFTMPYRNSFWYGFWRDRPIGGLPRTKAAPAA
jgi:hypothetical protein